MIAQQTPKIELTVNQQNMLDNIWHNEELLLAVGSNRSAVAADFVSFDGDGSSVAKTEYCAELTATGSNRVRRLWGYFGSSDSCCLAYIRTDISGSESVCLVLWIERDGNWTKTFHHENQKVS